MKFLVLLNDQIEQVQVQKSFGKKKKLSLQIIGIHRSQPSQIFDSFLNKSSLFQIDRRVTHQTYNKNRGLSKLISDSIIYMPPIGSDQKVPTGLSNLHSTIFYKKCPLASVTLREKSPYSDFLWSVFSRIRMLGNTDQRNSEY